MSMPAPARSWMLTGNLADPPAVGKHPARLSRPSKALQDRREAQWNAGPSVRARSSIIPTQVIISHADTWLIPISDRRISERRSANPPVFLCAAVLLGDCRKPPQISRLDGPIKAQSPIRPAAFTRDRDRVTERSGFEIICLKAHERGCNPMAVGIAVGVALDWPWGSPRSTTSAWAWPAASPPEPPAATFSSGANIVEADASQAASSPVVQSRAYGHTLARKCPSHRRSGIRGRRGFDGSRVCGSRRDGFSGPHRRIPSHRELTRRFDRWNFSSRLVTESSSPR